MKTKIRKFLWFDITPRKELYEELNECYKQIEAQKYTIESWKKSNIALEQTVWEYELDVHKLQEQLEDCLHCSNSDDSED